MFSQVVFPWVTGCIRITFAVLGSGPHGSMSLNQQTFPVSISRIIGKKSVVLQNLLVGESFLKT